MRNVRRLALNPLEGHRILVTGATSGIGRAIAQRCVAEGASVLATGRRSAALEELDAAHLYACDLREPGAPEALVAECVSKLGGLDGVAHAAGTVLRNQDPRSTSDEEIDELVRALAVDVGPDGIRVNAVAPGLVATPMAYIGRDNFDELVPAIAERHPLRRIGQPDDIAGPVSFLLSGASAFMTGQTIVVDGGFTIQ